MSVLAFKSKYFPNSTFLYAKKGENLKSDARMKDGRSYLSLALEDEMTVADLNLEQRGNGGDASRGCERANEAGLHDSSNDGMAIGESKSEEKVNPSIGPSTWPGNR